MKKQCLVFEKLYVMKEGMQIRTCGYVANGRTAHDKESLCYQLGPNEPFQRHLLHRTKGDNQQKYVQRKIFYKVNPLLSRQQKSNYVKK